MLKNYLVIAWRNALRHKLYSSINIIGLGIGIAFCLLMLLFVRHEWTYDSFHQHADDIYQVVVTFAWDEKNEKQTIYSPHPLAKVLKEEIPEIVQTVRFSGKTSLRYTSFNLTGHCVLLGLLQLERYK